MFRYICESKNMTRKEWKIVMFLPRTFLSFYNFETRSIFFCHIVIPPYQTNKQTTYISADDLFTNRSNKGKKPKRFSKHDKPCIVYDVITLSKIRNLKEGMTLLTSLAMATPPQV